MNTGKSQTLTALVMEEKLKELIAVVHRINTKTPLCAFMRYHGHVDWIEVSIAKSKEDYQNILFESYRHGITAKDVQELIDEVHEAAREELE